MRSLWPITIPGMPAKEKPTSLYPAPSRPISYQIDGLRTARCGSPARIGLPGAVLDPARAQQFDPVPSPAPGRSGESATAPGSDDEPASRYGPTAAHARSSTTAARPDGAGITL